jgi:PadR family transcriptional regulator AphA
MSAKYALLGLLVQRPAYPYELADRLQARLGPTWAINSGQLYQTIKRMEDERLIEQIGGAQEARQDRHIYTITEVGFEDLERWWSKDQAGSPRLLRRPLLLKMALAGPERLKDTLEQIDAYERDCAERLREFSGRREAVPDGGTTVRADHVLLRLGLSADIFQLEGELRWARHAHEMVSWLLGRDAIWPSVPERPGVLAGETRERREARERLFARIAAKHLRSTDQQGLDEERR